MIVDQSKQILEKQPKTFISSNSYEMYRNNGLAHLSPIGQSKKRTFSSVRTTTGYKFPYIFSSNVRSVANKVDDEISSLIHPWTPMILRWWDHWIMVKLKHNEHILARIFILPYVQDWWSTWGYNLYLHTCQNKLYWNGWYTPPGCWKAMVSHKNVPTTQRNQFHDTRNCMPPRKDDNSLWSYVSNCLDQLLSADLNSGILAVVDFNQYHPRNLCRSFQLIKRLYKHPTREIKHLPNCIETWNFIINLLFLHLLANLIFIVSSYNLRGKKTLHANWESPTTCSQSFKFLFQGSKKQSGHKCFD